MTVKELIDQLEKVDDKSRIVEVPFVSTDNWCAPIREINLDEEGKVELYSC